MKHRIYIDEVGNSDLGSSDNPNHRFLSLTGVVIALDHASSIVHPQMEILKAKYFDYHPDEPTVLHRKEIVNARSPFACLRDPKTRENFDRELLGLLASWHYIVISVCLDKKRHKETYRTWCFDPYHYCLAILLERYVLFLDRTDTCGDAMAESRGGREDRRLKDSFHRLWTRGTDYVEAAAFQSRLTSGKLKVKPKANNIAGLQLADLIAHPSRNEILHECNLLGRPLAPFAKSIIQILQTKYDQQHGRIYGKKFI